METMTKDVTHFDLSKPHMRITGETGRVTIVQNGFVYTYSIPDNRHPNIGGKVVGKVGDMKAGIVAQGHQFCDFCGYSFGTTEGLQEHLYKAHRDSLLVSLIQSKSEDLTPGVLPTEDQLKAEAERVVTGQEAEEALDRAAQKSKIPAVKEFNESKEKKKGAYREPLR